MDPGDIKVRGASKEMVAGLRKSLKAIEKALDQEPVVFIDHKGEYWANDMAQELISERKILVDDFMEWLRIGSSHLQSLSYGAVNIRMMSLPGNTVVAFLKHDLSNPDIEPGTLTLKEKEVLRYLVKGFSNKKIANALEISAGTVNIHLDNIYRKLGCSNRLAACFMALKKGLFLPAHEMPGKKRS